MDLGWQLWSVAYSDRLTLEGDNWTHRFAHRSRKRDHWRLRPDRIWGTGKLEKQPKSVYSNGLLKYISKDETLITRLSFWVNFTRCKEIARYICTNTLKKYTFALIIKKKNLLKIQFPRFIFLLVAIGFSIKLSNKRSDNLNHGPKKSTHFSTCQFFPIWKLKLKRCGEI